jgi:hypothetical protein
MAVQEHPDACSEVMWGKRLAAVRVRLPKARPAMLRRILEEAWELRAHRRR